MSYLEGDSLLKEIEKSLEANEESLDDFDEEDDHMKNLDDKHYRRHLNDLINMNKARKRVENFESHISPDSES
jgi:hypothetical protein